jgi:hypothetical protein
MVVQTMIAAQPLTFATWDNSGIMPYGSTGNQLSMSALGHPDVVLAKMGRSRS